MSDLISKQDAISSLYNTKHIMSDTDGHVWVDRNEVRSILEDLRGFEKGSHKSAKPPKRGYWLPQDHNKHYGNVSTCVYYAPICSECGSAGNFEYDYCPHCGVSMKEKIIRCGDTVYVMDEDGQGWTGHDIGGI